MKVVDSLTRSTKAKLLRRVAAEAHPKLVMPEIAKEHGISVADLQGLLNKHGYPRPESMRRAAGALEASVSSEVVVVPEQSSGPGPVSSDTLRQVSIENVHPDPDNPRDSLGDLTELAASLASAGMIQPIIVRKHQGRLVVVAGHRRLAAAQLLKWTEVPVIVRGSMRSDEVLAAMLIENGHRRDLDPIEEARGIQRLIQTSGNSRRQVAALIGRSEKHLGDRIALLALSPADQQAVRRRELPVVAAMRKGRMEAGMVRHNRRTSKPMYFSADHQLANRARDRCRSQAHKASPVGLGGVACGECWENVIRADERQRFHSHAVETGTCPVCDQEVAS